MHNKYTASCTVVHVWRDFSLSTCKNKSFHVCSNRSSRIRFGRALLICLCCCHFPFLFRFFVVVQDVCAVIFTHAMPIAFVKCQKKQIISMLDRILYESVCICVRACCVYCMLTDSLSIFSVSVIVYFCLTFRFIPMMIRISHGRR